MATPPVRAAGMDPLHITEFASDRYFTKFNQQQQQQQQQQQLKPQNQNQNQHQFLQLNGEASSSVHSSTTSTPSALPQSSPFILPLRETISTQEIPNEREKDVVLGLKQKKSRFHLGRFLHPKPQHTVPVHVPIPTPIVNEPHQIIPDVSITSKPASTFSLQFYNLPAELQIQIISSMPLSDILQLRLASKAMHAMVTTNESPIVRYHLQNNVPAYAKRLFPPDYSNLDFRYLCGLWHRLHVSAKLSSYICQWVTKEIFLRTSELQKLEFAPQQERMRRRLIPLLFTIFHFFETYRARHLQYIIDHDGKGLQQTPYTINPIEAEVMSMYDDRTLLQVHQVFPLVVASFCRRLRPPSYVGRLEKSLRGYIKDKPADEVHVATLCIGGLGQVERFWKIKGYNLRRSAVDIWYNSVSKEFIEPLSKPRRAIIGLGRKKSSLAIRGDMSLVAFSKSATDTTSMGRDSMDDVTLERCNNHIFHTSLADSMPMRLPARNHLRLLMSDLPVLQQLWLVTAEALILERKIVEKQSDIRRNAQVMLELIREDGFAEEDEWWYGHDLHDSLRPPSIFVEEDLAEDIAH